MRNRVAMIGSEVRMRYVLVVLMLVGCRELPKEPPEPPERIPVKATPAEIAAAAKAAADAEMKRRMEHPPVVDLRKMARDFKDNEIAGNQNYKGQRFRFVGTVTGISVVLGDPLFTLNQDVKCYFGKEGAKNQNLLKLRKGARVVFDGTSRGTGLTGDLIFHDCTWPYDDDVKLQTPELVK